MYDAAVAFAAWCNEHGGIQGREVVIDDLDAKLFDYGQRMAEACQQDFALVGGGGVFDSQGIDTRVNCGLPNIAGYIVSPAAGVADLQVQPVPNPVYEYNGASYRWLHEAHPDATNYGIMWVNLDGAATVREQAIEGVEKLGYDVVYDEQYRPSARPAGEASCSRCATPTCRSSRWSASPRTWWPSRAPCRPRAGTPSSRVLQPNFVDEKFAEERRTSMSETTYMRSAFPTFDMADEAPAMADYLELMERYNPDGKVAFLGAQGLSAFLLTPWPPTSAAPTSAGPAWSRRRSPRPTGPPAGCTPSRPPGNTVATRCSLMIHATSEGFEYDEELTEPNDGIYNCDEKNVVTLTNDYGVPKPAA